MKQFTDKSQTDKLMELGLPIPQVYTIPTLSGAFVGYYTIGELISFLPKQIKYEGITYSRVVDIEEVNYYSWESEVYYRDFSVSTKELIDSLYKACIELLNCSNEDTIGAIETGLDSVDQAWDEWVDRYKNKNN